MVDVDKNGHHKSYECNCSFHHMGVEAYQDALAERQDIVDYETTQLDQVYNDRSSYISDLTWVNALANVTEILADRLKELEYLEDNGMLLNEEEGYTALSKNVYVQNKFLAKKDRKTVPIPPLSKYSAVEVMGGNLDYEDTSEYRETIPVQGEDILCPTGI